MSITPEHCRNDAQISRKLLAVASTSHNGLNVFFNQPAKLKYIYQVKRLISKHSRGQILATSTYVQKLLQEKLDFRLRWRHVYYCERTVYKKKSFAGKEARILNSNYCSRVFLGLYLHYSLHYCCYSYCDS